MSDSSFATEEAAPTQTTYDQLVGEGKKFGDNEALAQSKVESDNHIATLEAETKQLREELEKRKSTEDLLAEIRANQAPQTPDQPSTPATATPVVSSEKDIAELVKATIQQERVTESRDNNLSAVESALQNLYGEHKIAKVKEKAEDLGVSVEFLHSVAASSPKAFYSTMGIDPSTLKTTTAPVPPVTTGGTVTTQSNTNATVAGHQKKSYFDAIRKENKKQYFSQKVQMQLFESRQALGEAFYS